MTKPSRQAEQWLDRTRKAYAAHSGVAEPDDDLALWAWLADMDGWARVNDPDGHRLYAEEFGVLGAQVIAQAADAAGMDHAAAFEVADRLITKENNR